MSTTLDQMIQSTKAYYCLECGICTGSCPVSRHNEAFSPRLMVERALLSSDDVRLGEPDVWSCLTCGTCSARCPVTVDYSQRLKPDLMAPGLDIRSAVPGGYASLPGTSMAGPHVAGAVALLWSAEPGLIGDIERTEALLLETAQPLTVELVCPAGVGDLATVCACGGDGLDSVPNNVYGWGQLDVWAAVQRLVGTDQ